MMTVACAFHYNAWVVVLVFVLPMLRDLYRLAVPGRVAVIAVFVLARGRASGSPGTGDITAARWRSSRVITATARHTGFIPDIVPPCQVPFRH